MITMILIPNNLTSYLSDDLSILYLIQYMHIRISKSKYRILRITHLCSIYVYTWCM